MDRTADAINQPQGSAAHELPPADDDVVTVPGDLAMPQVTERFRSLAWQFRHDNTIVPQSPGPHEPVQVLATSGEDMPLRRAMLYYSIDGSRPDAGSPAAPMEIDGVSWEPLPGFLTRWQATIPGQPAGTVVRYRVAGWLAGAAEAVDGGPDVWANDGQGFWFRFPGEGGITTFAYLAEQPRSPLPEWMSSAVVYHIFLDRFHPGSPDGTFPEGKGPVERHGGTLAGVRQALPYLAELGITCLWLSPLGPSDTYHRYDTTDYFDVDPALGTAEELRSLTREAHAAGMRVWLDFVPSHSSWRHPAFEAARSDRSAPTFSWFTFDQWPDSYRNFMQTSRYLPSLNTDNPGARTHLIDAALFWLREFDIDGYRLDHAIAPSMDFWLALRVATEAVKHDVVLVGEATDTPDCLRRYRGRLHGILDFPLARALRLTFGAGSWGVVKLDNFLRVYERYMTHGPGRVSFLDNHDMDRFLWIAGNDTRRLKMAAICQFTLGATPVVYYGTEIGMTQQKGAAELGFGGDAESRRDMLWDQRRWDADLLSFYRSLISVRRNEPVLAHGSRETVHIDAEAGTYAYLQTSARSDRAALTVFNLSSAERTVGIAALPGTQEPLCLVSSGAAPRIEPASHGRLSMVLEPLSAAIVRV